MLNRSFIMRCQKINNSIFIYKNATKRIHTISNVKTLPCLCGQIYLRTSKCKLESLRAKPIALRVHSTQSDHHRQKAVIETSTPKIVLEKIEDLSGKGTIPDRLRNNIVIWRSKVNPYLQLMRLDKPIGIWLLYWPCSWSIALGTVHSGAPLAEALHIGALFLTGAVLMRGAGCTINDLWDRDIDRKVSRTKHRPLVTGAISQKQAVVFLAAQLSAALAVLLQLNWFSVALGASSMALVVTYPLAKRFTNYPQMFLGATFNWGALLGYSAVTGGLHLSSVVLYSGAWSWTVLYDTIYAHQDKIDDARIGIKSLALTWGDNKPALFCAAGVCSTLLGTAGVLADLSWPYYVAVAASGGHACHQIYTLDTSNPDDCAKKFKSNTWIGLILFLGVLGGGYSQYLDKLKSNKDIEHNAKDVVIG